MSVAERNIINDIQNELDDHNQVASSRTPSNLSCDTNDENSWGKAARNGEIQTNNGNNPARTVQRRN